MCDKVRSMACHVIRATQHVLLNQPPQSSHPRQSSPYRWCIPSSSFTIHARLRWRMAVTHRKRGIDCKKMIDDTWYGRHTESFVLPSRCIPSGDRPQRHSTAVIKTTLGHTICPVPYFRDASQIARWKRCKLRRFAFWLNPIGSLNKIEVLTGDIEYWLDSTTVKLCTNCNCINSHAQLSAVESDDRSSHWLDGVRWFVRS